LPMGVRAAPRMTVLGMGPLVDARVSGTAGALNGNGGTRVGSPAMRVTATTEAAASTAADTVVVGLVEGEGVAHDVEDGALAALVEAGDARASFKHLAVGRAAGKR